jgi:hypothetical protein
MTFLFQRLNGRNKAERNLKVQKDYHPLHRQPKEIAKFCGFALLGHGRSLHFA